MAKTTPPASPLDDLADAINAVPDLTAELAELDAASERFETVRQSANMGANATDLVAKLNETHANLVSVQAKFSIARASVDELEAARAAYAEARDAADMAPGRRLVVLEELEKIRDEVSEGRDALAEARAPWSATVLSAINAAEREALAILASVAKARALVDPEFRPAGVHQIASALPGYSLATAGGELHAITADIPMPAAVRHSNAALQSATRLLEYVPDASPMARSAADARERQLDPAAIEAARIAAIQNANRGHTIVGANSQMLNTDAMLVSQRGGRA